MTDPSRPTDPQSEDSKPIVVDMKKPGLSSSAEVNLPFGIHLDPAHLNLRFAALLVNSVKLLQLVYLLVDGSSFAGTRWTSRTSASTSSRTESHRRLHGRIWGP